MIHSLHGAIGSYHDWSLLAKITRLVGHAKVEAHDLWSYCQSGGCSLWQFASLFNNSVEEKWDGGFQDLLGYSMGGRLALHALLENPSLWRSAVIVSAHTGLDESERDLRLERKESDLAWASLAADEELPWQSFLDQWNGQGVLKADCGSKLLDWYDRRLLCSQRREIAESFRSWSLANQDDLLGRLPALEVPVLWIVGEHDHKFLKVAEQAVSALPNAELLIIPKVGHRVPWEAPSEFHAAVAEWQGRLVRAK